MEVTQQAASKAVAELAKFGVVEMAAGPDRRHKRIRLSPRGWKLVRLGRQVRRRIDRRLARAAGSSAHEKARKILSRCIDRLGAMERIRTRRIRPAQ